MKIVESILTKNACYTTGEKITVKGLMLHSIGCPQPSAAVFAKGWNNPNKEVCVHAMIDGNTGDVWQFLPWNHRGWHAGGKANNTHIGVEMGEPAGITYISGANFVCPEQNREEAIATVKRTYAAAVELFAFLCNKYNLNPLSDGVIIGHAEGHARGIASNHADPEHIWKQLGLNYTMDTFRKAVNDELNKTYKNTTNKTEPAKTAISFKIRTGANVVYYAGPSVNSECKGRIGKGIFTIVGVQGEWGKLKSGAGWVSLNYANLG